MHKHILKNVYNAQTLQGNVELERKEEVGGGLRQVMSIRESTKQQT